MKYWIIAIAGGALALGLIAAPEAEGRWSKGPDVDLRFAGSSTVIDVDEETGDTSTLQVTQAKGKRGNAHLNSNVVYGPVGLYEGCPVFGADATVTCVATYKEPPSRKAGGLSFGKAAESNPCSSGGALGCQSGVLGRGRKRPA